MSLLHMVTAECNAWFPSGTLVKVAKRWMFLIDRGNIFLFNVTRSEFWESSHWILNCASNNVLSCHVFGKLKWLNLLDHAPNKNWNSDYDGCSNHSERKSKYYIFLIVLEGFLWGFFKVTCTKLLLVLIYIFKFIFFWQSFLVNLWFSIKYMYPFDYKKIGFFQ